MFFIGFSIGFLPHLTPRYNYWIYQTICQAKQIKFINKTYTYISSDKVLMVILMVLRTNRKVIHKELLTFRPKAFTRRRKKQKEP